jgi:hypothetical protein
MSNERLAFGFATWKELERAFKTSIQSRPQGAAGARRTLGGYVAASDATENEAGRRCQRPRVVNALGWSGDSVDVRATDRVPW